MVKAIIWTLALIHILQNLSSLSDFPLEDGKKLYPHHECSIKGFKYLVHKVM